MTSLVTLAEAKTHLRCDSDADDAWLDIFIPAISQAVITWLKDDWRAYEPELGSDGEPLEDSSGDYVYLLLDSNDEYIPKAMVKAAVLVELGQQYRFRDGSGAYSVPAHWGHGYVLGAGATALLTSLRKTTVR